MLATVVALAATAAPRQQRLHAQPPETRALELRGVIRDSASRAPVPGAVVMALDADGQMVVRTIASERGTYRMSRPSTVTQLRVVRLGFRPTTIAVPASAGDSQTFDVTLVTVPRALDAIDVVAARGCPVRNDRGEAFALLDQARAGLLATVVAREKQPAALRVLRYERRLDLDGIEIDRQTVQLDSSTNATTSFNAVRSAIDFVDNGFRVGDNGQFTYFGPDADVLLDERFQRGYCFSVAAADSAHRAQVGLRFTPASRRGKRIDIDGTLWIDTATRTLNDIEFRYLGVDALAESFGAGGRIGFRTLPSGVPFIDSWSLRLVGAPDTIVTDGAVSSQSYAIREVGGELSEARWPDGTRWQAPLGAAHITAVRRNGEPARGVSINLVGTDYRAVTDSLGRATIDHLVPGPYRFAADDPRLAAIDLQLPIARTFVARRANSALVRLEVPTAEQFVLDGCDRNITSNLTDALILVRIVGSDSRPLGGVKWRVSESRDGRWRVVSDNGITASTGLVTLCRGVERGSMIEVAAWRDAADAVRVRKVTDDRLSVVRVPLPTKTIVAQRPASDAPRVTVTGTVRDSVSGALVSDARVTFLGTPFEGATDSTGQFLVGGIARGAYTVEVSTPFLDSIGAVSRQTVSLRDSLSTVSLYVPVLRAVMSATCGADSVSGAIVGRVSARSEVALPTGLQIVAEWPEDPLASSTKSATRLRWVRAGLDPNGTYRLCGVPSNVALNLRTEGDSTTNLAALPQTVRVMSDRLFARADVLLDSSVVSLPVFTGAVITDSLGTPLENAEVTLTDINRTVITNQRGAFRMSDIPVGPHLVSVRKVGHAPMMTSMNFAANRTVEQRVLLPKATTLASVNVTAFGSGAPAAFEARRKNGLGRYLTPEQLERQSERRLSDVLTTVPSVTIVNGHGSSGWIVGKRAPLHIKPRGTGPACGQGGKSPVCEYSDQDLIAQGIYCPNAVEKNQGLECACYSQVFVDDHLMNGGRPTEPFDVNSIPTKNIAAVEFYASAAQTPGQYSNLQARCGVMLIWTRR